MSEQARARIFERLRGCAHGPPVPVSDFSVVSEKQWAPEDRILNLCRRLESVNGEVHQCGRENWVAELQKLLREKGLKSLLYAPETPWGGELADSWVNSDSSLPSLLSTREAGTDFRERVFNVDAALTGTLGGIAETGTLMLWPGPDEPRLMSLAPPLHIALLNAADIYNNFREALTRMKWVEQMPTNALLISGPSKTADIEQHLTYGVHGPRELIVLIRS